MAFRCSSRGPAFPPQIGSVTQSIYLHRSLLRTNEAHRLALSLPIPLQMVGVNKRLQQLKVARETLRQRFSHKMSHRYTKEVIFLAGVTRLHETRSRIQLRELHACYAPARLYQPHARLTLSCRDAAVFLFIILRRSRACGMCAHGGGNRLRGGI